MSEHDLKATLLRLLSGDEQLYAQLRSEGLLPDEDAALSREHLETARVVRTLVHELEINWPGVEVILRMRSELVATRRQVSLLAEMLRALRTAARERTEEPPSRDVP